MNVSGPVKVTGRFLWYFYKSSHIRRARLEIAVNICLFWLWGTQKAVVPGTKQIQTISLASLVVHCTLRYLHNPLILSSI
jgi:hypothetical protein